MAGTEIMVFDNYGLLEVKNTKIVLDMMGVKQETDTKVIMDGIWIYSIDNKTNTAAKMENPLFSVLPKNTDLEKIGDELIQKMGKKIGKETINGKDCEIWEVEQMMSKIWVWKSIPIKSEIKTMGMNITKIATSIEVNIAILEEKFNLPKEIDAKNLKKIDINSIMEN